MDEKLKFTVKMGTLMLKYGGEVYRVEDTMIHILKSLEVEEFNVYVLSNGIFASTKQASMVKHVQKENVRLDIIDRVNTLSRMLSEHSINFEEAKRKLDKIEKLPSHKHQELIIFSGIGSLGFTYLYGGNLFDAAIAFFIGAILEMFLLHAKGSKFIKNIFGAWIVCLCTLIVNKVIPIIHVNQIIIGCIMLLVPGIAITTSIRDLFAGDYLSGTIHLLDALLTALCIAVGVGCMMLIGGYLW